MSDIVITPNNNSVIHIPTPDEYKNVKFTIFNPVQEIMMSPGTIVIGVSYHAPHPVLVCLSRGTVKSERRKFGFIGENEYLKPNTRNILGTVKDYKGENLIIVEYD